MKETDNKKKASFIEVHANGYSMQKECLVDLQTGNIEVGNAKVVGSKFDPKSPVVSSRIEYRGTEYTVSEAVENNKKVNKVDEIGQFIVASYKAQTITEKKLSDIDPRWKPKNH